MNIRLVVFATTLLVFPMSMTAGNQQVTLKPSREMTLRLGPPSPATQKEVMRILEVFFANESSLSNKSECERMGEALRLKSVEFSAGRGFHVVAQTPGHSFGVSLSKGLVEWAFDFSQSPTTFEAFERSNGERVPVDRQRMKREIVRIDFDEALERAVAFVEKKLSPGALSGLERSFGQLVDQGSRFVYSFSWRNVPDESGVRIGEQRIRVAVNPTTGGVPEYSHHCLLLQDDYLVTPEQARVIATREDGDAQGFQVADLCLVSRFRENGETFPVWKVRSIVSPPGGAEGPLTGVRKTWRTCIIDANTAEVLDIAEAEGSR